MSIDLNHIDKLFISFLNENEGINHALAQELCNQYNIQDAEEQEVFVKALGNVLQEAVLQTTTDFVQKKIAPYVETIIERAVFEQVEDLEYKNNIIIENTIENLVEEYKPYIRNNGLNEYHQNLVSSMIQLLENYNIRIPEEKMDYCAKLENLVEEEQHKSNHLYQTLLERDEILQSYIKKDIIRKSTPQSNEVDIEKIYNLTESYELDYNNLDKYKDHVLYVHKTYLNTPEKKQSKSSKNNSIPKLI